VDEEMSEKIEAMKAIMNRLSKNKYDDDLRKLLKMIVEKISD
jgi:hypothetical protein